jgi:segregation and condensation protein B
MSQLSGESADSLPDREADGTWTCDEIERLYRQALDAMEAVADDLSSATRSLEAADDNQPADEAGRPLGGQRQLSEPLDGALKGEPVSENPPRANEGGPVDAARVIEALLFVGRQPLTVKAICSLLRGEFDAGFVEQAIEEINRQYEAQNRPYEICLGDGGYRIVLRPEYESLRNRVYGFGPRRVRLSQATLEILAIVAYRQPVSRRRIEESAQKNAGPHLRQLLERGLVAAEESENQAADAEYRTTPRFLRLFGLARLEDLPQVADLAFK